MPLPIDNQHSVVDVAVARPAAPTIVVDVDATDPKRTVENLLAEADAGRMAVWVRWGPGRIAEPPAPIRLISLPVVRSQGRFSRRAGPERPAPTHSTAAPTAGE